MVSFFLNPLLLSMVNIIIDPPKSQKNLVNNYLLSEKEKVEINRILIHQRKVIQRKENVECVALVILIL